jgi:hypothetical protein
MTIATAAPTNFGISSSCRNNVSRTSVSASKESGRCTASTNDYLKRRSRNRNFNNRSAAKPTTSARATGTATTAATGATATDKQRLYALNAVWNGNRAR